MSMLDVAARRMETPRGFQSTSVEAMLDQFPLGLLRLDEELRIRWWNRAAEELSGRRRSDVLGLPWNDDLIVTLGGDAHVAGDEARRFLRHHAGHLVPVRTQTVEVPWRFGGESGDIVSIIDATPSLSILKHARRYPELDLNDPHTGLGNRRLAALEIEAHLIRHQLHRRQFGIALFDIDLLHHVNERYGFDCSDRALTVVARTLYGCLDDDDTVCRWGGDQFLALIVGERDAVETKAELCCRAVEWCRLEWFGEPVPLSVSGGVDMAAAGDRPDDLIGHAAFRLRMSKRLGRNRITSCPPDQAE